MSAIQNLKAASSLRSIARLLNFRPSALSYLLFIKPNATKYRNFQISKKSGGARQIMAPSDELKLLQRRLSDLLVECISEGNLASRWKDKYVQGFTPRRSFITNADLHRNQRYVFNLDLEDFFGTINFGRVRGFFIKNNLFQLHPDAATVIAQIACHDNVLPQGSPSSPVISNLVGHVLDVKLCRLASNTGCIYSRYADDITFSTNKSIFPVEIACLRAGCLNQWDVGAELDRTINSAGYRINQSKTRMQFRRSRQNVTGIVVNWQLNTRVEYRKVVRAMVHELFEKGEFLMPQSPRVAAAIPNAQPPKGRRSQLRGMLEHIRQVDFYEARRKTRKSTLSVNDKKEIYLTLRKNSRSIIYRSFLLYDDFYSAERPTIFCEGETDLIHLQCAITKAVPLTSRNLLR